MNFRVFFTLIAPGTRSYRLILFCCFGSHTQIRTNPGKSGILNSKFPGHNSPEIELACHGISIFPDTRNTVLTRQIGRNCRRGHTWHMLQLLSSCLT